MDERNFSENCPHCGCTDEDDLTEINGHFTTGAHHGHMCELHLYHCRNCGIVFGSDV